MWPINEVRRRRLAGALCVRMELDADAEERIRRGHGQVKLAGAHVRYSRRPFRPDHLLRRT